MTNGPERGGHDATERLVRRYLPLAYNIVGWALDGYSGIERVAHAAMAEALRADGKAGDTPAFRSRLVAACAWQVRKDRQAAPDGSRLADAPFVRLMVERLGLVGDAREVVLASRWLDDEERLLLSLWRQQASGALTLDELAHGLRQPPAALSRFIGHLDGSLQESRVVDRALRRKPVCGRLAAAAGGWDRKPSPVWRDRLADHVLDCPVCLPRGAQPSTAEWLLSGLPPLPPPATLIQAAQRSVLSDDSPAPGPGAGRSQRPAANRRPPVTPGDRRPPAKGGGGSPAKGGGGSPGRGLRSRSGLAAMSAGVVLCVLVAVFVAVRGNGSSPALASAISTPPPISASSSGTGGASQATPSKGASSKKSGKPGAKPSTQTGGNTGPAPAPGGDKGVGVVSGTGVNSALAASGAAWYYNWSSAPDGISTPSGMAFVPMIKTAADANTATLDEVKHEGNYLLGFNEPDVANQADMSVSEALSLWPKLEATGMELGSPSVSGESNSPTSWLGQFMSGAQARGYRINFITLHWYGQNNWDSPAANVNTLRNYLIETYDLYHLPIWITEFSLINFDGPQPTYPTSAQEASFLTAAAQMLSELPFVQRYAWYSLTDSAAAGNTILYSDGVNTSATAVGEAFKKLP